MSMNHRSLCVGCAWAALAMASVVIARGAGPVNSTEPSLAAGAAKSAARLDTFAKDGDTYFALSLSPTTPRPAVKPRDVVILFDTSASQTGAYREKAMAALDATLAGLGAGDQVRLYAVDLNTIPLMDRFAAPNGPELRAALTALRERVPLGATDMSAALSATSDSFATAKGGTRGNAALYIGDGHEHREPVGQRRSASVGRATGGAARTGKQLRGRAARRYAALGLSGESDRRRAGRGWRKSYWGPGRQLVGGRRTGASRLAKDARFTEHAASRDWQACLAATLRPRHHPGRQGAPDRADDDQDDRGRRWAKRAVGLAAQAVGFEHRFRVSGTARDRSTA